MTVEWAISNGFTRYPEAVAAMEARATAIAEGRAGELVWLVEHPALYTRGASAKESDLLDPGRFPVFDTQRGGSFVRLSFAGPTVDIEEALGRIGNWVA